ncbi:hypothetical protein GCM10022281_17120 [Sphingomonas rosea]|uniref:PDZ domain-containing protein n=1 Tax=Sphingomonas rosea TaxID=335605 RepID=A0ABP7U700_9SPHN
MAPPPRSLLTSLRDYAAPLLLAALIVGMALVLVSTRMTRGRQQAEALLRFDRMVGATVQPVTSEVARTSHLPPGEAGLFVTSVANHRRSADPPLRVGDVVARVDGKPVATPSDLVRVIRSRHARVALDVHRGRARLAPMVSR